jgi:hypothetical protein
VADRIVDVAPGLWLWQTEYEPGRGWEGGPVASTCVESAGEIAVLDAKVPREAADEVWARLDVRPPTFLVVLNPDHVRDVDLFARRYGVPAYGPDTFHRGDVPETDLDWIGPGSELPGGLVALYDGRNRNETPLWLPEQRTIVFADALAAPDGELRVWWTPWHDERVVPALTELLGLTFECVIVSHGDPVHDREAFERAHELPPWRGD